MINRILQFFAPESLCFDENAWSELYRANQDYRRLLDDHGYRYTYVESPGAHIWKNWRLYLTQFLPQLFR